jgi:hypothetical protein
MACTSQRGSDIYGKCLDCAQPVGASGCDGGSWVHLDMRPCAVISSVYSYGKLRCQTLRNGVFIRYKNGGIEWPAKNVGEMRT